ncbi:MAG: site-specific integrase [Candidatus Eremiobacteraeota bacterium]|nr:site-specific integrase [Candidatus Eremiobacteraeota bacterium]MBC5827013.1 site-specific integrase [Candidatus Eremiobacteraeota bacterium]
MPSALMPANASNLALQQTDERARDYARAGVAANTRRAYAADLRHFDAWCRVRGFETLPASPVTLSRYIADLALSASVSTVERRLAAISKAHQAAGHPTPTSDVGLGLDS